MVQSAASAFLSAVVSRAPLDATSSVFAYAFGLRKMAAFARSVIDFESLESVSDKKELLLDNLDPMFNVSMGHFFTCGANSFIEQMERLPLLALDS